MLLSSALPAPRWTRQRIGLLGGSFNPPHEGHLHISLHALKALKLDAVWWLVSPQNPLKDASDTAALVDRLHAASALASRSPQIHVTDLERILKTQYTVDTLAKLRRLFPRARFVWLMGADNMVQFHQWKDWQKIASSTPIAVFDRAPYTSRLPQCDAARALAPHRLPPRLVTHLAGLTPPVWAFLALPRHPASSTALRQSS